MQDKGLIFLLISADIFFIISDYIINNYLYERYIQKRLIKLLNILARYRYFIFYIILNLFYININQ